jgi:hypothetical protein
MAFMRSIFSEILTEAGTASICDEGSTFEKVYQAMKFIEAHRYLPPTPKEFEPSILGPDIFEHVRSYHAKIYVYNKASDDCGGANAFTDVDDRRIYFCVNLKNQDTFQVASVIEHETRHIDGFDHIGGWHDFSFAQHGAIAAQVEFATRVYLDKTLDEDTRAQGLKMSTSLLISYFVNQSDDPIMSLILQTTDGRFFLYDGQKLSFMQSPFGGDRVLLVNQDGWATFHDFKDGEVKAYTPGKGFTKGNGFFPDYFRGSYQLLASSKDLIYMGKIVEGSYAYPSYAVAFGIYISFMSSAEVYSYTLNSPIVGQDFFYESSAYITEDGSYLIGGEPGLLRVKKGSKKFEVELVEQERPYLAWHAWSEYYIDTDMVYQQNASDTTKENFSLSDYSPIYYFNAVDPITGLTRYMLCMDGRVFKFPINYDEFKKQTAAKALIEVKIGDLPSPANNITIADFKLSAKEVLGTDIAFQGRDYRVNKYGQLESKVRGAKDYYVDPRMITYRFKTVVGPFVYAPQIFGH